MESKIIEEMQSGFETAFIDGNVKSNRNRMYRPEFVYNNKKHTVLSSIEAELSRLSLKCDEFAISVAFITMSGITPLLQSLKELKTRNIPGRILTTDYLNFSEPKALKKLHELSNLTVKMYVADENQGFHTKGYIFKKDDMYRIIVGSSNLTAKALTTNSEWNTKIVSTEKGEYAKQIIQEFDQAWQSTKAFDYEDFIENYTVKYNLIKKQRKIAQEQEVVSLEAYRLQPNKMQSEFVNNLNRMIEDGKTRALLISATGTGKTYASAFALREVNPKKALFLVHREQIAEQTIKSYERVFGDTKKFGLLSGTSKDFKADYLFSTMLTMAKNLDKFRPDEFQFIIIDEAHRIGSKSYQNIMEHFQPQFWLGMTASPERTDTYDVYKAFDYNIAYEIRLQGALEEDMLCPFHYFGITDLQIDGQTIDEKTGFNRLTDNERVEHIRKQMEFYGYSGNRAKGLVFCSSKNEAEVLSEKFNRIKGYQTLSLTGKNSQKERASAIERLVADSDQRKDWLNYIFTVDIFNEGVDIPEINQVVLLRPTKSPIVFVQQLGRGLRKADGKEYVVILDFIGNYKNNFMIPMALSGDTSYNKDNLHRYLKNGDRILPGESTIHFDEISRERIYAAIDKANFNSINVIEEKYRNFKNELGDIPALMDFVNYKKLDILQSIFDNKSLGSYYKFLVKCDKNDYEIRLSDDEAKVIEFVSKKLANGKRIHELALLDRMLTYHNSLMSLLRTNLQEDYNVQMDEKATRSVINVMTNEFPTGQAKKTYEKCVFLEKGDDGDYEIATPIENMLKNPDFYDMLKELVKFGISRYKAGYDKRPYTNTSLVLYQKYTYEDVCRLLNWSHNVIAQSIGGYWYDKETKTFSVFINYDKDENISDTTKYKDYFKAPDRLIAISKQSRTLESDDVQNFLHAEERGIDVELFVRKNKNDKISKEFYYLGRMTATGECREFVMDNTDSPAVEIEWKLDKPVRKDIYEYIINA